MDCIKLYKKIGINYKDKDDLEKQFRIWSLKNHPDKGGDLKNYQEVSGCKDDIIINILKNKIKNAFEKQGQKKRTPEKNFEKEFKKAQSSPGFKERTEKIRKQQEKEYKKFQEQIRKQQEKIKKQQQKKSEKSKKECPEGKFLNSFTGRCKKIPDVENERKAPCKPNTILNPKTGRCVSINGKIGKELRGF